MIDFVAHLLRHDPKLLERRMASDERDPRQRQRRIVGFGALCTGNNWRGYAEYVQRARYRRVPGVW
jgi:hypothetical protein